MTYSEMLLPPIFIEKWVKMRVKNTEGNIKIVAGLVDFEIRYNGKDDVAFSLKNGERHLIYPIKALFDTKEDAFTGLLFIPRRYNGSEEELFANFE